MYQDCKDAFLLRGAALCFRGVRLVAVVIEVDFAFVLRLSRMPGSGGGFCARRLCLIAVLHYIGIGDRSVIGFGTPAVSSC